MSLLFKNELDSQEFFVANVVISYGWWKLVWRNGDSVVEVGKKTMRAMNQYVINISTDRFSKTFSIEYKSFIKHWKMSMAQS